MLLLYKKRFCWSI